MKTYCIDSGSCPSVGLAKTCFRSSCDIERNLRPLSVGNIGFAVTFDSTAGDSSFTAARGGGGGGGTAEDLRFFFFFLFFFVFLSSVLSSKKDTGGGGGIGLRALFVPMLLRTRPMALAASV